MGESEIEPTGLRYCMNSAALNTILSMPADPNYLPELNEAQAQARQMLEQLKYLGGV